MEEASNEKSEETKTAARLQDHGHNRCDRKSRVGSDENLSGCRAHSQGNPYTWEKNQMRRPKWYSPQLSREIVSRLYLRAKAERVPMTVLANQLMVQALGNKKRINAQTTAEKQHLTEPK